jgi:ABC-type multidrug transport system fused ATPase/permease subunit
VALFRLYRAQVAAVFGLIVVASTIGIINPLLIQAVFNKALFVPGGPNLQLLVILAVVPVVNGAIGILQTYEATRVGQQVMRDLRDRLYAHLQTLPLAFFTSTKTGEIQSRLANNVGGVQTVVTSTAVADGRAGYTRPDRVDGACCLEAEHGVRGSGMSWRYPARRARSAGLMPTALTLILICPSPGSASGTPAHFRT